MKCNSRTSNPSRAPFFGEDTQRMAPTPIRNVIIGGILLHLTLGTLYSWGCVQPYVTSYIRMYHPTVTMADSSIVYASASLGQSLTTPCVGFFTGSALGLQGTAALGASLVAGVALASSRATTVFSFSVLNVIFGIGVGLAYTCPLVSGYAWMPNRKGAVSGFVVAGFGAGAAVFDMVATAVVNPDNAPPDPVTGYYGKEVAGRVPLMYMILGSCYLVLGLFGSWMIANPPEEGDGRGPAMSSYVSVASRAPLSSPLGSDGSGSGSGSHCGESKGDDGRPSSSPSPLRGLLATDGEEPYRQEGAVWREEGRQDSFGRPSPLLVAPVITCSPTLTALSGDGSGGGDGGDRLARDHQQLQGERPNGIAGSGLDGIVGGRLKIKAADDAEGGAIGYQGGADVGPGMGQQRQLEVWSLVRESDFYHLALTMLCTGVSGLYIAGNYKGIARDNFPNADRFLSILGSVASLFNALGRIVGGLSVDRFGALNTLLMQAVSATCMLLILRVAEGRTSFFLAVCLMHSLYGSNFAIYPTLTAEFFGAATAGPNYGLVFMVFGLGSFVTMLWLSAVAQTYGGVFLACTGISLAGTASAALLWRRRGGRHRGGSNSKLAKV